MIKSIALHELRLVLCNRKTWFCLAALHALMGIIFNWLISIYLKDKIIVTTTAYGITEKIIHPYYAWFSLLILFMTPMIATQILCAEKVNKTMLNYQTAPISTASIIFGKYLAVNLILVLAILAVSILPLSLLLSSSLDWGQFIAGILGAYLMLSATLAVGCGISSFMHNITRSNFIIFLAILSFILLEWAAQYTGPYAMYLQHFGLLNPLKNFLSGVINLQSVCYYACISYIFLTIGTWELNKK